jgi:hypothetical protein
MIQGFVDLLTPTRVAGWAMESSTPGEPLKICVLFDGKELVTVRADLFRQDLKEAGIGDGAHGFRATFAGPLPADAATRIEVCALDDTGRTKTLEFRHQIRPLKFVPARDNESAPVFILGSPRSGTSAMAAALRAGTRYRGFNEGHLLQLLPALLGAVSQHYQELGVALEQDTMLATLPQPYIEAQIGQMFLEITRARYETPYWIDKTPSNAMIQAAPLFAALWPKARFIFMMRRGIENVASRLRKFQQLDFEAHCRSWADAMLLWSKVRNDLTDRYLEVDQLTMAREPAKTGEKLARLLDLNEVEIGKVSAELASRRPEQTGGSADEVLSLTRTGWSDHNQLLFRQICGPMMQLYRYEVGENYFKEG